MHTLRTLLCFLTACNLASAQGVNDLEGVVVTSRATSHNASQIAAARKTKLNLTVEFVQLPEQQAAMVWSQLVPTNRSANQIWIANISDAVIAQVTRWKATQRATPLWQFSVTTFDNHTVESSKVLQSVGNQPENPGGTGVGSRAFLSATPRIDSFDRSKISIEITAGMSTNLAAPYPTKRFSTPVSLEDGQTVLLGNPLDDRGHSVEKSVEPKLLLLVTAVIADDPSL
jgi:hypothetical protein